MKHAEIVRVPTSDLVVSTMVREGYEVAAGVRQPLAQQLLWVSRSALTGRRVTIQQAMAARKDCTLGLDFLQAFVQEMKASGFIARGSGSGLRPRWAWPTSEPASCDPHQ